ncbi:RNA polymerase sigma-70 factor [Flagellimonas halotolerans]|uniref:RNA polymerase sigma-70 factor n=1 Tax=Flagellimonas halotolerans TaxID=3112164 RepID=A0ABU6ITN5_9FLAO|nr:MULTISPECIES: RNA polymerase sigma-70 factor [unclassified Allomuricauda]MEC3966360.1 RNA polymerase sigma-70 factor [Muricauda sp. SYSU M86414]MEC4266225.1 RNA polymerase sigma-70 factor [Muricauda sp. SYSU M84420]
MTEIEAVAAMKSGDQMAFKYLFNLFYDRLVAYITTYTHDKIESEEIVQQAFISFWENKSKLDETKSPKSYLYAIVYNKFINSIKKSKKQNELLNQIWERALSDRIEEDTDALQLRIQKMKKVIEELPPKCKEIIIMNKIQGIKYKDIADQLGISVKTVESQMRIAFTKIREAFKENDPLLFLLFK